MVFFITVLRALAACLITNAHYTGIYPTDLIANGGLIGDVIFFAVSGYCLTNTKKSFPRWYGKRVVRCYVPVIIMTAVYMLLGFYSLKDHSAFWWYAYPTYYHFIASIIVLYVPFYIIMKTDLLKKNIPYIMMGICVAYVLYYVFGYDKTYYHIDTVREPMVRFLFMESMLLGAWFKFNDEKIRDKFSVWFPISGVVCFGLYFVSKIAFSKIQSLSSLQIINQFVIFILLYFVMRTFAGLDGKLERLPSFCKKVIDFIAKITLEIYLVQYVLIDLLRKIAPFPINWLAVTAAVIVSAFVLHIVSGKVVSGGEWLIDKISGKKRENK